MSASVCVSVCFVREDIFGTTRAIFTKCFVHVADGCGSAVLRQGDEIPRFRGIFGGLFSIDNALYRIAFGTHTKTAESIKMPFGMMSGLGLRTLCG